MQPSEVAPKLWAFICAKELHRRFAAGRLDELGNEFSVEYINVFSWSLPHPVQNPLLALCRSRSAGLAHDSLPFMAANLDANSPASRTNVCPLPR